jgi:hypothetical protein
MSNQRLTATWLGLALGELVVETLPYTTGPQRLIGVRQWKDKKKDKDKK